MSAIDLSIVVAISGRTSSIHAVVAALQRGCDELSAEIIMVMPDGTEPGDLPNNTFAEVRIARCAAGTLTPVLWGVGLALSRGPIVAFTTDQMRVAPGWARALQRSITGGVVGAAGPIDLAPGTDPAATAAYFLRFSAFAPERWPTPSLARDIPGDNAAYERKSVFKHVDLIRDGFWEVEFHRRFERAGLELKMVPDACATFVGPVPFGAMLGQRFRHGKEFGASRVTRHAESRVRLLLSAPFVPFVLLARIGRRALGESRNRGRFIAALPWLGALATWWAAGEAVGAWRAPVANAR